jgi:hypothetical protein
LGGLVIYAVVRWALFWGEGGTFSCFFSPQPPAFAPPLGVSRCGVLPPSDSCCEFDEGRAPSTIRPAPAEPLTNEGYSVCWCHELPQTRRYPLVWVILRIVNGRHNLLHPSLQGLLPPPPPPTLLHPPPTLTLTPLSLSPPSHSHPIVT